MSCIGAVVNKMMQINGEMIFENYIGEETKDVLNHVPS